MEKVIQLSLDCYKSHIVYNCMYIYIYTYTFIVDKEDRENYDDSRQLVNTQGDKRFHSFLRSRAILRIQREVTHTQERES